MRGLERATIAQSCIVIAVMAGKIFLYSLQNKKSEQEYIQDVVLVLNIYLKTSEIMHEDVLSSCFDSFL